MRNLLYPLHKGPVVLLILACSALIWQSRAYAVDSCAGALRLGPSVPASEVAARPKEPQSQILLELATLRQEIDRLSASTALVTARALAKQYRSKLEEAHEFGVGLDEMSKLRLRQLEQEHSRLAEETERNKRLVESEINRRPWRTVEGIPFAKEVSHLAMNPKFNDAVEILKDGTANLIDASKGVVKFQLSHNSAVTRASFSADGRRLLTITIDWKLYVWDTATGEQLQEIVPVTKKERHGQAKVESAMLSSDGSKLLATLFDGWRADLWDTLSGKLLHTYTEDDSTGASKGVIFSAQFSPTGEEIITAGSALSLWSSTGMYQRIATNKNPHTRYAAFGKLDNKIFVKEYKDRYALYDRSLRGEQPFAIAPNHPSDTVLSNRAPYSFGSDDAFVLAGTRDRATVLWDSVNGRLIHRLPAQAGNVINVFLLEQKNIMVAVTDKHEINFWDLKTGALLNSFAGMRPAETQNDFHEYPHASISADGDAIAVVLPGLGATLWRPLPAGGAP